MNTIEKYDEEKKLLIENIKVAYKKTYYKNMLLDIQKRIIDQHNQEFSYHEIRNTLTGIYRLNASRDVIVDTFIVLIKEHLEKIKNQNLELKKIVSKTK